MATSRSTASRHVAFSCSSCGADPRPTGPLIEHFIKPDGKSTPLREIDQAAIDACALALFPDHSPATRNREVYTPISAVLKHAGPDFDFKIRRPKGSRGKVVTGWLWPEQAFRIFDAAASLDAEFAVFLHYLCYTGCRISEALRLTCNEIRISEAFAFHRDTKNGDPRAVYLPPVLVTALANHPRGLDRGTQRAFRFHQGGPLRYAPVVIDIFTNERPIDRSDWLGLGVFLSWQSTIMLRLYSIAWRWMGQPEWLTDSDILSYGLFVQFSAGILHLAAPGALNARVPTRRWINIGIWVGVFVLVALVLGYFFDALAIDGFSGRER